MNKLLYSLAILIVIVFFGTSVASELVVVSSKSFPVDSMTKKTVTNIFIGKKQIIEGVSLKPVDMPNDTRLKANFVTQVLKFRNQAKYNSYWVNRIFQVGATPPQIVKSTSDMLRLVSESEGAIGYCLREQLGDTSGLKILYSETIK